MKVTNYKCNICVKDFSIENLIGIKYVGLRLNETSIQVGTNVVEADAHICKKCIKLLHDAVNKGVLSD